MLRPQGPPGVMSVDDLSPKVYVVDDDEFVRDLTAVLLKTCGFLVRSFPSAHACLQAVEHRPPDCIVTDLEMPAMTGAELAHTLRARSIDVPCLIVTSAADSPLAQEAKQAGVVTDVLEKPVDHGRLADAVRRAIRRPAT